MRLLRYKGAPERGEVRRVEGPALDEWRQKVVSHLNSTDRADQNRYRYETDWATSKDIELVAPEERIGHDTAMLERMEPQKPLEGRETVEIMAKETMDQWLHWKRTNPELYRKKLEEAKLLAPGLSHLTVEQLGDQIMSICRRIEEAEAAVTYKRLGLSGGWGGAVVQ